MFEEIFDSIREKNSEILCIGIWGKDGLELERKNYAQCNADLELIGAQIADVVSKFENIKDSGSVFRLIFESQPQRLVIYSLTGDYFLVVVADPRIIPGKLNFYIQSNRERFTAML